MSEHLLFLTGKLAEKRLRRTLGALPRTAFSYTVENIGVNVAALMTTAMIKRRLKLPERCPDRVVLPGLCNGDLEDVSRHFGAPFVRGPEDIKDIPAYFGQRGAPPDLSRRHVLIFAEIADAPHLTVEGIVARAERYRRDGADVIDLGCIPGVAFPHLEDSVTALREAGFKVSVDSLDAQALLRGGKAGADYLLSLTEETLWIADETAATPVLIPEPHGDLAALGRAIETCAANGRECLADPILDPIHFGFTDSLLRYRELRRRFPELKILMGIGNLTELTEADTSGVTALLFGVISELGVDAVLTTQISPHARRAISEADRAARLMHAAKREERLPKGIDDALLTTHARAPFPYSPEEIAELAAAVKDPSYRVEISEAGLHVYNRDDLLTDTDPYALFRQLTPLHEDAPHAFYMGVELAHARIAWQLGKRYTQDQALDWGVATDAARGGRERAGVTTRLSARLRKKRTRKKRTRKKRTRKKTPRRRAAGERVK